LSTTPRPNILVIDDDPAARLSLVSPLRESGHDVSEAATVSAALAALASTTPTACVLDLSLDVDASPLHAALAARRVPTLLVSGRAPEKFTAVADPHGWSYLAKPVAHEALLASVSALLPAPSDTASRDRTTQRSVLESLLATAVDVLAILTLRTVLLVLHPAEWLQALCIMGILLLAGVRLAELGATLRGLPTRGGPGALVVALGSAFVARAGSGS
jgi:CheY-like chemotaxis protein